MTEIMAAVGLLRGGDRSGARARLEAIWSRIADEPAWDIRALNPALCCTDAGAKRHSQALSIAAFMPSLHVNLGDDYFKLGDFARNKGHLASEHSFASALADDPYGPMIHIGR